MWSATAIGGRIPSGEGILERGTSIHRIPSASIRTLCQKLQLHLEICGKLFLFVGGAVEILEAELREAASNSSLTSVEGELISQQTLPALEIRPSQEIVRIDHMALALSNTFRSPIIDTIQSLPQHQQIILCSAVKYFRGGKKDTTIGELNKSYLQISTDPTSWNFGIFKHVQSVKRPGNISIPTLKGMFKLGQSRDDKLKRVTLKVDEADILCFAGSSIILELSSVVLQKRNIGLVIALIWWHRQESLIVGGGQV
ncbi:putative pentatricopeptide repeat-containing protein [Hibiscus syriacus]|uniref:Pentatricopeptide repeat-containing protein n=1 Tax=Hibiscus syriacus TaxID=106335 RepID=A0A6A3D8U3_HIBSY|nr:putative pentatricopeptide repeat-containing protein [Hibiscus syriacus]